MVHRDAIHSGDLPYLTNDLPGVGGGIKRHVEDFVVEEVPAYEKSGEGTHVYLWIEKRGITTQNAVHRIAAALGKTARDVGYAGLKDSRAVTRQWLSVEHVTVQRVEALDVNGVRILDVRRHTNKLKLGHLRGNRFEIRLRDLGTDALSGARAILDVLARRGMPNYFGPQRFGARGDNWLIGRHALLGNYDAALAVLLGRPQVDENGPDQRARRLYADGRLQESADAWPRGCEQQRRVCRALVKANGNPRRGWQTIDRMLRRLYLSAFQSYLFNHVLADRIDTIDRLETGDIACKHANGACFRVDDAATEQSRCDAFEISPTGPLFGYRMTEATGEPGRRESAIAQDAGLREDDFRKAGELKLSGERRPLRVPVRQPDVSTGSDEHGPYLLLTFALPPGCYATCLTREMCRGD